MINLYQRLGLRRDASEAQIRAALDGSGRQSAMLNETHVLTDPERRRVYDRNHRVLETVGVLRANLGLNLGPYWTAQDLSGFTREAPTRQPYLDARRTTTATRKRRAAVALILIAAVFVGLIALLRRVQGGSERRASFLTVAADANGPSFVVQLVPTNGSQPRSVFVPRGSERTLPVVAGEYRLRLGWGDGIDAGAAALDDRTAHYGEVSQAFDFSSSGSWRLRLVPLDRQTSEWRSIPRGAF